MASKGLAANPDWLRLQRKIFTRWVNQKVSKRNVKVNDIVADIGDGLTLITLLEVLSEKKYPGKIEKNPKMRVQKIDNCNNALNFCWSCGVQVKIKPSAENLVDENEVAILGLVWSIMLKYLKIGDEDGAEQLNAKDALLLWVQNKTAGYPNVKVDNFSSSFHDGLALCAIIYKHRPKLIPNFPQMTKANAKDNLRVAIDAAEAYFGLEKYLTPEDIPKLDENSMVVYISEYYYGIAEQRKIDIAARRIGKVIRVTKELDALKIEFTDKSKVLLEHINKAEKLLSDRTIDNTMAGAKKRIEDFYVYKSKDKNVLINAQLDQEALYNNLAMKLTLNKRQEFQPAPGASLKDIEKAVAHLEACEQERKVALHAELNRQIQLAKLNEEHGEKYNKLNSWIREKKAYLEKKEEISSVSGAQLHLRLLDAYDKEAASVHSTTVADIVKLGDKLESEKFERVSEARVREGEIETSFLELGQLSTKKRPVLEDDLEREKFKERVRLVNKQHVDRFDKLKAWTAEKTAFLKKKEIVNNVTDAQTHLTLLEAYEKEKTSLTATSVAQFKLLGQDVITSKYATTYSSWQFETPNEVTDREAAVDADWETLSTLSVEKKAVLQDDLAREQFKEKVRLLNKQHINKHEKLSAWISEKETYLTKKEVVSSISDAQTQLTLLESYEKDKISKTTVDVAQFKQLGAEILAQEYKSQFSSWKWETPEEVNARHAAVEAGWENLSTLSAAKKEVLLDDLAREQFREKLRLLNEEHIDKQSKLLSWADEQEAYLKTREEVLSVSEAHTQLSLLEVYQKEKASTTLTQVALLQQLGADILAQKYETKHSSYVFPNPTEITDRESTVHARWGDLDSLAIVKKDILEDHLARELFKEKVRLQVQEHIDVDAKLQAWVAEKEAYLNTKESINSVSEAQTQLTLLEAYEKEKVSVAQTNVAQLKALGADIRAQKYATKHSAWVFETPEVLTSSESAIDAKWESLSALSATKKTYLEAELAKELEKERLRLEFAHLATEFVRWKKDTSEQVTASTHFGFTLAEVEAHAAVLDASDAEVRAAAQAKEAEARKIHEQGVAVGVTHNVYTTSTPDELANFSVLEGALAKRKEAYAAALARERANDALCRQFAGLAEPFSKWISDQKDAITTNKDQLETQLATVEQKIASVGKDGEQLVPIKAKSDEIEAAGITNNLHTSLTYKDLEVQWNQWKAFLERKRKMVVEEIETAKLRGLTQEQLNEISENFKSFDHNKSGTIDKKELKACLYSLGEEKSKSEIDDIIVKYGRSKEGDITYEGFREFMILIYGDADTKDEIVEAFALINRGQPVAKKEVIEIVMPTADVEYFTSTAPQVEGGYDYSKWLQEIYAR